ncbi:MAG: hypothetical protein ACOYB1_18635 [Limnohabitans sp.]
MRLENPSGRDPEDSIDYRLDAGPPEKERRVAMISFRLEIITNLIKKLLRIKK